MSNWGTSSPSSLVLLRSLVCGEERCWCLFQRGELALLSVFPEPPGQLSKAGMFRCGKVRA